jgi:dystrophin
MQSHRDKVQKITEEILKLCNEVPSFACDSNVNDIKSFISYWDDTNKKINNFDNRLSQIVLANSSQLVTQSARNDETIGPPVKLSKAIEALSNWLDKAIVTIDTDLNDSVNDSFSLEKELKKFEDLEKAINSEKSNLKYVNNSAKEILQTHNKSIWREQFCKDVEELNSKWDSVNTKIEDKIDLIKKSIRLINVLEEDMISIDNWMDEVNVFLNEDIAIGDLEALEEQLEQCDKLQNDIKSTLQSSVDNVNKNALEITKTLNYKNAAKFHEINEKWEKLKIATIDKNNKLKIVLENSQSIDQMLTESENWIFESEDDIENAFKMSGTDFQSNIRKLKLILNRITNKKQEIKNIRDKIEAINFNQLTTGSLEEMKQRFSKVEKALDRFEELINEALNNVKKSSTMSGELKRLIMNENDWLDKLEKKLKRSPQLAADAEEISECLDVNHLLLY